MKKTLTIFLLLAFVFVLKGFFTAKAYASEEFGGTEKTAETYILKTENLKRRVSAESQNDKITLQTAIDIDVELVNFWHGMNPDILIIRLMTETGGLELTYYSDITEEPAGILEAEYKRGKEEVSQSAKVKYEGEIGGIVIKIEFKEDCYFIDFEARVESVPGTFDFKKEELKVAAEGINTSAAKLSFELISREDPGWEPEVKINTVLKTALVLQPNEEENKKEEPQGPESAENKEQNKNGGASIVSPETNGRDAILIAAGGAVVLSVTTVLIVRSKRRKI